MNKIVLASALLSIVCIASAADAGTYTHMRAPHAAKIKVLPDYSMLGEGRSAYSATYSFVEHDPAFSPQQDEIYNAR